MLHIPRQAAVTKQLAIDVVGLGKAFRIYDKPHHLWSEIISGKPHHRTHWALKDISFQVRRGEVVGIIGRNGAGKSTLLKLIAGTLAPTEGHVRVNGSLSAILELGTGFNPELTGRDNVIAGGMCMGMSRSEVMRKLDAIVDFSELRDVIDQPFKTYSSGMQSRLTFSTAISVDPDILIVDEALAAGDAAFVEKCLYRMEEIVKRGATVMLVTHNTNLIPRFGDRAIWIENGRIRADGDARDVSKAYEIATYSSVVRRQSAKEVPERLGDQRMRIEAASLDGVEDAPNVFIQGKPLRVNLTVESEIESDTACFCVFIFSSDGRLIWSATNHCHLDSTAAPTQTPLRVMVGLNTISLDLPHVLLNSGTYYISAGIEPYPNVPRVNDYHDWRVRLVEFGVVRTDHLIVGKAFDSPSTWTRRDKIEPAPRKTLCTVAEATCSVRSYPFPFRAAIAISNDCEFMNADCYRGLGNLLNKELGLEVPASLFFFTTNSLCHSSISYFDGTTARPSMDAPMLRDMAKAGWIDTIHAYGDFDTGGFHRQMAIHVAEECAKHGLSFPIFSNHGSNKNLQNLGHLGLANYQRGD
ncbi:MAG: ABC transporter ATP-binding protein, partial [Acetobacteraceae bacterium]|nr:ABC transporter ATP-binding protein [Acetobacteraceae bacterium]